jgi:hypothetical protein
MKALEKDRSRRYETASALARDIQRYLNDEPVQACPPSAWYRFRKLARRNRVVLATGLVVGLAVLLAVIVLAVSYVRIRRETQARDNALTEKGAALSEAQEQRGIARANELTAKAQTVLARRRLHASQMNLAMQAWRAGEVPRVLELLEGQRPGPDEDDLRGFEWYYLWRLCHGGRRVPIKGHTEAVLSLAFSPDGKTLASVSWDRTVRLWDTATGRERLVLQGHLGPPWHVASSPDGKTLASGSRESGNEALVIWDAVTGRPRYSIAAYTVAGGEPASGKE